MCGYLFITIHDSLVKFQFTKEVMFMGFLFLCMEKKDIYVYKCI